MMDLIVLALGFFSAIGVVVGLTKIMNKRPRWMGFAAFLIMIGSVVAGIVFGFPGSGPGNTLFVFGVATALSAWTVHAPRLTSVIIWSLVASMFLSAALILTLPIEFKTLAIWMALAVSLIWVAFQFWCYWDKHGWRVASGLITISIVSGYIVFTTPPPA